MVIIAPDLDLPDNTLDGCGRIGDHLGNASHDMREGFFGSRVQLVLSVLDNLLAGAVDMEKIENVADDVHGDAPDGGVV